MAKSDKKKKSKQMKQPDEDFEQDWDDSDSDEELGDGPVIGTGRSRTGYGSTARLVSEVSRESMGDEEIRPNEIDVRSIRMGNVPDMIHARESFNWICSNLNENRIFVEKDLVTAMGKITKYVGTKPLRDNKILITIDDLYDLIDANKLHEYLENFCNKIFRILQVKDRLNLYASRIMGAPKRKKKKKGKKRGRRMNLPPSRRPLPFLAEVQGGTKLNKVNKDKKPRNARPDSGPLGGLTSLLAGNSRFASLAKQGSDDSDDSDDSDWGPGDGSTGAGVLAAAVAGAAADDAVAIVQPPVPAARPVKQPVPARRKPSPARRKPSPVARPLSVPPPPTDPLPPIPATQLFPPSDGYAVPIKRPSPVPRPVAASRPNPSQSFVKKRIQFFQQNAHVAATSAAATAQAAAEIAAGAATAENEEAAAAAAAQAVAAQIAAEETASQTTVSPPSPERRAPKPRSVSPRSGRKARAPKPTPRQRSVSPPTSLPIEFSGPLMTTPRPGVVDSQNLGKDITVINHINSSYNGHKGKIENINGNKYVVKLASLGSSPVIEIFPYQIRESDQELRSQSSNVVFGLARKLSPVRYLDRGLNPRKKTEPAERGRPLVGRSLEDITRATEEHYHMTINKKGLFGYKKTKVLHGLPVKLRESFFQRRLREGNNSTDLNYLLHLCDLLIPGVTERSRAKRWLKENTENPNFSQFEKQFFK